MANDSNPTYFMDDATKALRIAEVPLASFDSGMNAGGSNAVGIGINMTGGAVVGTPEQFTLLDQFDKVRVSQRSQHLGGNGYSAAGTSNGSAGTLPAAVIYAGTNDAASSGVMVKVGSAALTTLAGGWLAV